MFRLPINNKVYICVSVIIMNALVKSLASLTVSTAINSSCLSVCMTKLNKCRGQENIGDSLSVTFGNEIIEASYLQSKPSGQRAAGPVGCPLDLVGEAPSLIFPHNPK